MKTSIIPRTILNSTRRRAKCQIKYILNEQRIENEATIDVYILYCIRRKIWTFSFMEVS